jgi:hypothetical protein
MPELRMVGSTFELNIRGRVKARVVKFEALPLASAAF